MQNPRQKAPKDSATAGVMAEKICAKNVQNKPWLLALGSRWGPCDSRKRRPGEHSPRLRYQSRHAATNNPWRQRAPALTTQAPDRTARSESPHAANREPYVDSRLSRRRLPERRATAGTDTLSSREPAGGECPLSADSVEKVGHGFHGRKVRA